MFLRSKNAKKTNSFEFTLCFYLSVFAHLLGAQPGVDERVQGVLVVCVQPAEQGLDGHGGHFLTACGVVVDDGESQRGEEQPAVLEQQVLREGR